MRPGPHPCRDSTPALPTTALPTTQPAALSITATQPPAAQPSVPSSSAAAQPQTPSVSTAAQPPTLSVSATAPPPIPTASITTTPPTALPACCIYLVSVLASCLGLPQPNLRSSWKRQAFPWGLFQGFIMTLQSKQAPTSSTYMRRLHIL